SPTLLQQISTRLTADALKADVSFLASDALEGRGTPSPGLDIAAEYIAAQFRRGGLEPAGDDAFFQTAHYEQVAPNLEGLELSVTADGQKVAAEKSSLTIQDAAAADVKDAPVMKVSMSDATALDALTEEQVRGKALVLELPDAAAGRGAAMVV